MTSVYFNHDNCPKDLNNISIDTTPIDAFAKGFEDATRKSVCKIK